MIALFYLNLQAMDNQNILNQHRAIFLATIDFFLKNAAGRVIADGDDVVGKYYKKLQLKAEGHYQSGNLEGLQQVMREIDGSPRLLQDNSFVTFIKEQTGYNAERVQQILPERLSKTKSVIINGNDRTHKKLAEIVAPDNKRKIIVRELERPSQPVITSVDIQFEQAGASVYMVEGVNLDITVYWKDNNTVIIETRKEYVVLSKHAEQYQSLDDVVKVEYVYH